MASHPSPLERVLSRALTDLADLGLPSALVGGLAVSARSDPRFTRDVDLAVAVEDDPRAEGAVRRLLSRGYAILTTVEQKATGRLATVRLRPPGESEAGVVLDLLFASSGIEVEAVQRAEPLEIFPGLEVPVVAVGDLLAMKVLSRNDDSRPQDYFDLRALLREAEGHDLDLARASLRLIARRGYNRKRDLITSFEELLPPTP